MEDAISVAEIFTSGSFSLFSSAQASEILSSLRNDVTEKLEFTDKSKSPPRRQFFLSAFHQC